MGLELPAYILDEARRQPDCEVSLFRCALDTLLINQLAGQSVDSCCVLNSTYLIFVLHVLQITTGSLEEAIASTDVLYVTRIQKERFATEVLI